MSNSDQEVSLYRAAHHLKNGGLQRALKLKEGEPISLKDIKRAQGSSHPHVALMGHLAEAKHAMDNDPQGATKAMAKDVGF